jgi:hypothetical protein
LEQRVKIDAQSVYVGMGALGAFAAILGALRRELRFFVACIAGFLAFELICLITPLDSLRNVWWTVHAPSAILLGVDEILERHGVVVSTVFHLADFVFWSALATGIVRYRKRKESRVVSA